MDEDKMKLDKRDGSQPQDLRDPQQAELEAGVKALQTKVADGNRLLAGYEQATE